jgi:hypothetical protein
LYSADGHLHDGVRKGRHFLLVQFGEDAPAARRYFRGHAACNLGEIQEMLNDARSRPHISGVTPPGTESDALSVTLTTKSRPNIARVSVAIPASSRRQLWKPPPYRSHRVFTNGQSV